jgi:hypothetical protein
MNILRFTKTIINLTKLNAQLRENATTSPTYTHLFAKGSALDLHFSANCTQPVVDAASSIVNNFVEISVREQLEDYLETKVQPFVADMMLTIMSENIESGITQAGKTNDVLGFFNHPVTLPGAIYPVSLAQALDTGSLYSAMQLIDHHIANPAQYETLSPFVTVARLGQWKTKIITFLQAG